MCCTGNIATAVLQEATEMTISPELMRSIHTSASISSEKDERQREKVPKEEAEGEVNQFKEMQKEEIQEKKDSLLEESLRMTSWVEVGNEKKMEDEEEMSEKEGVEKDANVVVEQALWETNGRHMGEAEKEQTRTVEEELAMMEEKWREQCAINETLKQRLADEEKRFRVRCTQIQSGWKCVCVYTDPLYFFFSSLYLLIQFLFSQCGF